MRRILVTDDMRLAEVKHPDVTLDYKPGMSREELLKVIGDYDALITRSRTKVDRAVLEQAGRLVVIGRGGVGVDNIDLTEASRRGILVINVPGANTRSAAELTLALMLTVSRGLALSDRLIREGKWDRKFLGAELMGKTLGIVGLGRVGSQVARFAKAMDMQVLAYDPYIPRSRAESLGVSLLDSLEEMLPHVHYLTVHTPLTEETRGMVGRRELYLLPKGAIVVNAARGSVIQEEPLLAVLDEGHLAGAGLDVFASEPPEVGYALVQHPKVVHTAHLGANTREAQTRVGEGVIERVTAALHGDFRYAINTGFDAAGFEALDRFITLGESLGRLLVQIVSGRVQQVEVSFFGEFKADPEPIATAVAKGILDRFLSESVNLVAALPVLRDRGIRLVTHRDTHADGYPQVIEVRLVTDEETRSARGTVVGGHLKLVGIDDFALEVEPSGHLLICVNYDKPGVVGKVGTLLGERGVNIAGVQLGRDVPGGRALFVLKVDEKPDDAVVATLRGLELLERVDPAEL